VTEVQAPEALDASVRILIATANAGKVREIREILEHLTPARVEPLESGTVSFPDEGDDYEANAIGKARAVAMQRGAIAIGDDSGLEVDALGGRPGVHSARYGGEKLDAAGRVARLLNELDAVPAADRTARFVCYVALVTPDGACFIAHGECRGRILDAVRGDGGFGYDPVFQPEGMSAAMAELTAGEKNRISHRAVALRALFSGEARPVGKARSREGQVVRRIARPGVA
jgi:XTP/dITP diphosphohydrolase